MSEECLKNAQDLTKSQKHDPITDSPTWIQEMLAHLKMRKSERESEAGRQLYFRKQGQKTHHEGCQAHHVPGPSF